MRAHDLGGLIAAEGDHVTKSTGQSSSIQIYSEILNNSIDIAFWELIKSDIAVNNRDPKTCGIESKLFRVPSHQWTPDSIYYGVRFIQKIPTALCIGLDMQKRNAIPTRIKT
ncbi:hypothetical protein DKX38_002462 [Salix brachista]|uniref:Uncharacterized protein n=1 Tax=Salix brachista TaxID=2182728 RepID=A0A5N5NNB5_9ROSI|nr:hypothetical protein DKX38_002462 [Salix brachista]